MLRRAWPILLLLGLFQAGCAISPPPPMACNFTRYTLQVEDPPASEGVQALQGRPGQLASVIHQRLARRGPPLTGGTATLPAMLFMSGGSQQGAFGAGFLDQWAKQSPSGRLPTFDVVTGISTGSILATFAFTGDTQYPIEGYSITNETQLLTPYLVRKNGSIAPQSIGKLMRHGAVANLEPLRKRLAGYLTDDVLGRVRDGHQQGRLLLVGVVDVDTGEGVALDLTEMGARYFTTADPAKKQAIKTCYIEAIAASSSAPMAAVPSFIDNRMYVDGGARFGMFSDEIGSVIKGHAALVPNPQERARIFLIANGDQDVTQHCGKADPKYCQQPYPASGGLEGEHAKWKFVDLALRSESILVNQVYRFSADKVRTEALLNKSPFKFAKIEADADNHVYTLDDSVLGGGTKTCAEWTELDRQLLNPLQFYPRYMRCLIDYGRTRAKNDNWAAPS